MTPGPAPSRGLAGQGSGTPTPEGHCPFPFTPLTTVSLFGSYSPPGPRERLSRGWEKRKAWGQVASGQRVTYDLKERICIGSMTTLESAAYQRVPTDEAEAQMLASADLDGMKSEALQYYLHYQCVCPFVPCFSCVP